MGHFIRENRGLLYILAATLLVVGVFAFSGEIPLILRELSRLDVRWVLAAAACILLYLLARGATLYYFLRTRRQRIRFWQALMVTGVGQFYSAVTPSASGGQPAQVVAMHRMGIPVSVGTQSVLVKYLGFQSAILSIGGVLWLTHARFVWSQLHGVVWLVALGYVINLLLMSLVFLSVLQSDIPARLIRRVLSLGQRLRLVRHREKTEAFALAQFEDYRRGMIALVSDPGRALAVLLLSMVQIFLYILSGYCVWRAFSLTDYPFDAVITMLFLLFIAASFIPLPGAAGAQEGGYYLFFRGMMPEALLMPSMTCWRFFTYYMLLLLGLAAVVLQKVCESRRRKRRASA